MVNKPLDEEAIFKVACRIEPPEARADYLEQVCGDDLALADRVAQLLRAHEETPSFLESPPPGLGGTIDFPPVSEKPGSVIGRYKLLEQIGEGGFGVVFMAEQQHPVRRKVALKVIKPGMDTRQVIARFEAERQALALMDHPNIARVLDAGTTESEPEALAKCAADRFAYASGSDSGRPYFVMELVRGSSLTDYCDQHNVPIRDRLQLFLDVCQAVQHAHQKGIIHRDIKPSNVLVTLHDGKPVVKVIDFGIAKAMGQQLTDKTLFTNFAQMIGTPLYMSPEQAEMSGLDVDTRSDIYSLGVLLYELLTGTTPFDKERLKQAGFDEIRRIIREEEPPKPSTRMSTVGQAATTASEKRQSDPRKLSRLFRGELDWIVMKALEKDRNRRYDTASGFAADVGRYLKDEAVQACPPSAVYRLRKFARRNKAVLATASMFVLGLVLTALLVGANWLWWAQRRAAADGAVGLAMGDARLLRDEAKTKPFGDGNLFREALAAARKAEDLARASAASGEMRQQAADLGAEVQREAEAADRDRRLLVRLLDVRGPREGPRFQADAQGLMVALAEPGADEQFAAAFGDWGLDLDATSVAEAAARLKGRPAAVVTEVVAALDHWASERRRQGKPHVESERLADLAAALDDQPDSRRRELRAILTRGNLPLERALGAVSQALLPLPALTRMVPWSDRNRLRRLAAETDATKEPVLGLLTLARALQVGGDDAVAERLLREGVRARPAEVVLHDALGKLLEQQRPPRWREAVECYAAARALRPELGVALAQALLRGGRTEEGLALIARLVVEKPVNPWLHFNLGNALAEQGKHAAAEAAYREALGLRPDLPEAHLNLGNGLSRQGRYAEAEAEYREALRLQPSYPGAHYNLGSALYPQGKHAEAEAEFREALRLRPDYPEAHLNLGVALAAQGRHAKAVREYREALRLRPDYPPAHNNLGNLLSTQGKLADAEAEYREALRLQTAFPEAHNGLGNALYLQAKLAEAEAEFRESLRLRPDNPEAHNGLGNALNDQGKPAEAEAEFREALRLRPDYPEAHINLARTLQRQGRFAEALDALKRGHELGSRQPGWPYPSAQWVRQAEQFVALDAKLPKVFKGEAQPADVAERLALAQLCQEYKKLYAAAARFYAEAFAAESKLADDLQAQDRYNAACAAALAGCGQGEDAAQLDDEERARLRRQALDWLRADLTAWGQLLEKGPDQARAAVRQTLRHWQQDADFAGVHGDALAKLPEAERQPWQQLWADVEQTLKNANHKDTKDTKNQSSN